MNEEDIEGVMETVLYDFPLAEIRINLPEWVEGLANDHWIKTNIINTLKQSIASIDKIRDINNVVNGFNELPFLEDCKVDDVSLGEGVISMDLCTKQELFYEYIRRTKWI